MNGFDALGKLALGQLPEPIGPFSGFQVSPPSKIRAAAFVVLGSSMVLLATNHAPFLNGFQAPINSVRLAPPDQFHVNIGNFPNAAPIIPFDWNKPKQPPAAKDQPNWGLNLNLFTNPIPFAQYDWLKPHQVPNYPIGVSSQFNLNLRIPPRPVIPNDLTVYRFASPRAPDQIYPNLLLSAHPVIPNDLSKSSFPRWRPDQLYPNLPLLFLSPFTPVDYSRPHAVMLAPIPVFVGFQLVHSPSSLDTHDGVWVKRKRKKLGPDPIEQELAEKASRRAALELAIYGPEVEYQTPPVPFEAPAPAAPNVSDLARVIALAQVEQYHKMRLQTEQDDEDDLEAILREIL